MVFSQVMEFLPHNVFQRCVARCNGDFNIPTQSKTVRMSLMRM
ncbi:MAG: DUF4372 domain-containing protein [Deltaproteobacteria bacterium]|nr:DUF4372 domain-containing protein [Deltaproteobacteria bacterium]